MAVGISFTDILLLPVLIGYTIWWTYDLRRGSRIHRWTLALHLLVYGLAAFYIWAVSLGEIVEAGGSSSVLTWVWTLVLTLVGVIAAEIGIWYGNQRMIVERTESGAVRLRGPIVIAVFWLALYLTRFGLEDGVLGGFSVFLPPGPAPSSVPLGTFEGVVLTVASLYLVSFGFLLGVSVAVWNHHAHLAKGTAARNPVPPSADTTSAAPASPVLSSSEGGRQVGAALLAATPASSSPPPSGLRCPSCGGVENATAVFCGECGHRLEAPIRG